MCACKYAHSVFVDQRTALRSHFPLPTFPWVPEDGTQVIRLGKQPALLTEPPHRPYVFFLDALELSVLTGLVGYLIN